MLQVLPIHIICVFSNMLKEFHLFTSAKGNRGFSVLKVTSEVMTYTRLNKSDTKHWINCSFWAVHKEMLTLFWFNFKCYNSMQWWTSTAKPEQTLQGKIAKQAITKMLLFAHPYVCSCQEICLFVPLPAPLIMCCLPLIDISFCI